MSCLSMTTTVKQTPQLIQQAIPLEKNTTTVCSVRMSTDVAGHSATVKQYQSFSKNINWYSRSFSYSQTLPVCSIKNIN